MNNILDEPASEGAPASDALNETISANFKFIAVGILCGLGISMGAEALRNIFELLWFEIGLFGILNKVLVELITILLMGVLISVTFQEIKISLSAKKLTIQRLLVYTVIFYLLMFALQIIVPVGIGLHGQHLAHYQQSQEALTNYSNLVTFVEFMSYFAILVLSIYLIINIGRIRT